MKLPWSRTCLTLLKIALKGGPVERFILADALEEEGYGIHAEAWRSTILTIRSTTGGGILWHIG